MRFFNIISPFCLHSFRVELPKGTGHKVGLLVNFQNEKAEIKRMVLNLPKGHDSFSSVKSTDENI